MSVSERAPRDRWALVSIAACSALVSGLAMGSPAVRLANTHADDGPILSSMLLLEPARFAGDIVSTYARVNALASIQNWLPALLHATLGLSVEAIAVALVILQNVLPVVGMFVLAHRMTASRSVAWLSAALMLAADPASANLANYVSLLTVPYAGTLVLGPLLLAAASLVASRPRACVLWLSVAALVHPAMSLYMVGIGALYLGGRRAAIVDHARQLGWLLLPAALCVGPALLLRAGGTHVSVVELFEAMRRNMHMHPWVVRPLWIRELLELLALVGLALPEWRRNRSAPAARLWSAALVAAVAFAALHVVAWWIRWPLAVQLIPLRATTLLALVSVPLAACTLLHLATSPASAARMAAAVASFSLAIYGTGLVAAVALVSLVPWRSRIAAWGALGGWLGGALLADRFASGELAPPGTFGPYLLGILVLSGGFAAWSAPRGGGGSNPGAPGTARARSGAIALVALLTVIALRKGTSASREVRDPLMRGNLEAQMWARTATSDGAIFIVRDVPWRTLSRRRAVEPRASRLYVYSASAATKAFDDAYLDFYGLTALARSLDTPTLEARQRDAFRQLDAGGVQRMAARFGGDYVVRRRGESLDLPIAHENEALVVYALHGDPARVAR